MNKAPNVTVAINYTNYKGECKLRRIQPQSIRFGSSEFHPEVQWLMKAIDLDKKDEKGLPEMREFAMKDIHSWTPIHLTCGRIDDCTGDACLNPATHPGSLCMHCEDFEQMCKDHDTWLETQAK